MKITQEVRVLNTSIKLITEYVNYSLCSFPEDRNKIVKTVLPQDNTAKKLFFILLLEMTSSVNIQLIPEKANGDNLLDLLQKITESPILNQELSNVKLLKESVNEFKSWIDSEFEIDIYSANISKEFKIKLLRKDAIYLIGNRCKHAITRSNVIIEKLKRIYNKSGFNLEVGTELLILEDIDNALFDDFAGYHFTKICELSANIYFGIVDYVFPIYKQSVIKIDNIRYSYSIPSDLNQEESKYEFYELLNQVRSPFLPVINTCKSLQNKY
jgi:hypothetical protein